MTIFFHADHHFQHKNILEFRSKETNELLRPNFKDINEHDNTIIANHNRTVGKDDLTYFLGDVTWKTNLIATEILQAMNGRKRLVVGNHDDVDWLMSQKNPDGSKIFEKVYLWKYFPEHNLIASHVPLSPDDLKRAKYNVHGHIHERVVKRETYSEDKPIDFIPDRRYLNVAMEQSFTPVSLEDVLKYFNS